MTSKAGVWGVVLSVRRMYGMWFQAADTNSCDDRNCYPWGSSMQIMILVVDDSHGHVRVVVTVCSRIIAVTAALLRHFLERNRLGVQKSMFLFDER